ncbi:MAG: shikimate dehydrogenase [Fibrobacter sp.]|nr:shikimate dehydrogenase [Fibrobacter sp.]
MSIDSHIRGDTRIVYLLGYPVAHSISPQIHNHAFRTMGLPYAYIPLAIPPGSFHSAVYALRAGNFAGANITIPHKIQASYYCDRISDLSRLTGTVNTLYLDNGLLHGTTTDPEGFKRAVKWMGCELCGSDVVILGNGGVARTLAIALAIDKEINALSIIGRNLNKVSLLAKEVSAVSGFSVSAYSFDDERLTDTMKECTLLVNCTSAGMHPSVETTPIDSKYFHKEMVVFDTIYNPSRTRLLDEAKAAGCRIQNGLRMLLYQGLASFKLWTGYEVNEDIFDISELENMVCKK